jgi:hypothetical protein
MVKMEHSLDTRDVDGGNIGELTRYSKAMCVKFSSDFLQNKYQGANFKTELTYVTQ